MLSFFFYFISFFYVFFPPCFRALYMYFILKSSCFVPPRIPFKWHIKNRVKKETMYGEGTTANRAIKHFIIGFTLYWALARTVGELNLLIHKSIRINEWVIDTVRVLGTWMTQCVCFFPVWFANEIVSPNINGRRLN